MTIPRVTEAPEQGVDGGSLVRVPVYVQDVVSQDACISEQYGMSPDDDDDDDHHLGPYRGQSCGIVCGA